MEHSAEQQSVCRRFGSDFQPPDPGSKVGIALHTLSLEPLNALRHVPEYGSNGWYIWGGEELSASPDFFAPLHASHLADHAPALIPYMGLAPGFRVLLAPGQEDVWFDPKL